MIEQLHPKSYIIKSNAQVLDGLLHIIITRLWFDESCFSVLTWLSLGLGNATTEQVPVGLHCTKCLMKNGQWKWAVFQSLS